MSYCTTSWPFGPTKKNTQPPHAACKWWTPTATCCEVAVEELDRSLKHTTSNRQENESSSVVHNREVLMGTTNVGNN